PALSRVGVGRAAHLRVDETWRSSTPMRVMVVDDQARALISDDDDGPHLMFADDVAPEFFLGVDDEGVAYAAAVGALRPRIGARPMGLREVGALLDDRDAGLLTHAVALANWHDTHTHCPVDGTPTVPGPGGHFTVCPSDGTEHFPRTDPAVIMLVTDPDDRCLLARNAAWPGRRVSILAGFVDPGESAEQAVIREVAEETQIKVTNVRYVGSQPWPMPRSLMLGFRADAPAGQDIVVDREEIAEAYWFSRDELVAAIKAREIALPPPISIARQIIEQ